MIAGIALASRKCETSNTRFFLILNQREPCSAKCLTYDELDTETEDQDCCDQERYPRCGIRSIVTQRSKRAGSEKADKEKDWGAYHQESPQDCRTYAQRDAVRWLYFDHYRLQCSTANRPGSDR